MKRSVLLAAAALACTITLPGYAADTLGTVAANNKITFAYRDSSVPFSYLAGADKPVGFGVDISNAVLAAVKKELGKNDIQVGWQSVTSANRIPLLVNGTIDLECGSTTNNSARGKEVSFATNYFYTGTRLMVKKSAGIQNWAELKGKKVAITTGTTNMQVVRRYNDEKSLNLDIVGTKDHADAAMLVETGRAVPDVVQQLQAVEKALEKVKSLLIFDHIEHHLFDHAQATTPEARRSIEELKALTKYL